MLTQDYQSLPEAEKKIIEQRLEKQWGKPTGLRLLITGGRDFSDAELLKKVLDDLKPIAICHGAAKGADTLAGNYAAENKIPCIAMKAHWDRDGKAAGMIRNRDMLVAFKPDKVVAFPGGKGTEGMVQMAHRASVPVIMVPARVVGAEAPPSQTIEEDGIHLVRPLSAPIEHHFRGGENNTPLAPLNDPDWPKKRFVELLEYMKEKPLSPKIAWLVYEHMLAYMVTPEYILSIRG